MKILAKTLALALVTALAAGTAAAGKLSVEANTTIPVRLNGAAASVVLGNKNIADVAVHDEHLIFVTGKTYGTTNLLVFNKAGQQIYAAELAVSSKTANQVTVNRSGQNFTYNCAPNCRDVLAPGDEDTYFEKVSKQQQELQRLTEGN